MELIVISSSKLKIMLSADDMSKYALGAEIDYADRKTRQAFRSILDEAREKTGFDTESEKIYIQLYPSRKGGCEVYVTKIDDESEQDIKEQAQRSGELRFACKASSGIIPAAKHHTQKEKRRAYSFSSLENMLSACRRILSVGWCGQSSAFSDGNKHFYILLKEKGCSEVSRGDKIFFICEYGNAENFSYASKYLCEHGNCICESNAIEKLGNL